MDTCFLFTKHLDDEGCLSLKLTPNGDISAPLLQRNFTDIKVLQKNCITIIIESSESASILELDMPWLPERKARVAIPYALEDKLAESIEDLHFAFDKQRYQNNRYLITVISKLRIQSLMLVLAEQGIEYEQITLDWFALEPQELCISGASLLINNDDFKGTLSSNMAISYLKKHPLNQATVFQDSQITTDMPVATINEHSYVWIAQRILKSRALNLCQGYMQHGNESDWISKGYKLAGALFGLWLLSLLLVNAFSLYSLNKKNADIDEKIAVIYHEFFPEAKQVISPKFRINQLLKTNASDSETHFWFLLNQFAKAAKENKVNIEQVRYQSNKLLVTLVSADFPNLEHFQNQLKELQLKVKQTQASTRDQQVVATLELS